MPLPRQPERDRCARLRDTGRENGVDADCAGREAVDADRVGAEELPRIRCNLAVLVVRKCAIPERKKRHLCTQLPRIMPTHQYARRGRVLKSRCGVSLRCDRIPIDINATASAHHRHTIYRHYAGHRTVRR